MKDTGGRSVLVVGAAGGIGAATASMARAQGMRVAMADLAGDDGMIPVDVRSPESVREAVGSAADGLGGLDGVVYTVGLSGRLLGDGPVDSCTDEGWATVMDVNLGGAFRVCRVAVPRMMRGGSIVLVGSVLGLIADPFFQTHSYAASKAGLIGLARAMAVTYAPVGIRVNVVAPGVVDTPMSRRVRADGPTLAHVAERQPLLGRMVTADQVAGAILFFLSAASEATTGVVVPVDGGWTAM